VRGVPLMLYARKTLDSRVLDRKIEAPADDPKSMCLFVAQI